MQLVGKTTTDFCGFPFNVQIWSLFASVCVWASFSAEQGSRGVRTSGNNAVRAARSANTDRTQRFVHHARVVGLENIPLVTNDSAG